MSIEVSTSLLISLICQTEWIALYFSVLVSLYVNKVCAQEPYLIHVVKTMLLTLTTGYTPP